MRLQISDTAVEDAIFDILQRESVAVGGWIRLSAIARQWRATGLRYGDMVAGVARLDTRGYLYLQGNESDTFAVLCKPRPPLKSLSTRRILKTLSARSKRSSKPRDHDARERALDRC